MFQQVINATYEVTVPGKEHTAIYELKDCSNKCNAEIRFITTPEQMTIQSRIELEEDVWMDAYKYVLDISRRDPSTDLSFMICDHAHASICLIADDKLFQPVLMNEDYQASVTRALLDVFAKEYDSRRVSEEIERQARVWLSELLAEQQKETA